MMSGFIHTYCLHMFNRDLRDINVLSKLYMITITIGSIQMNKRHNFELLWYMGRSSWNILYSIGVNQVFHISVKQRMIILVKLPSADLEKIWILPTWKHKICWFEIKILLYFVSTDWLQNPLRGWKGWMFVHAFFSLKSVHKSIQVQIYCILYFLTLLYLIS